MWRNMANQILEFYKAVNKSRFKKFPKQFQTMVAGRDPRRPKRQNKRRAHVLVITQSPRDSAHLAFRAIDLRRSYRCWAGEEIGTLQSDSLLPFIKCNGFKTSLARTRSDRVYSNSQRLALLIDVWFLCTLTCYSYPLLFRTFC
jgi:hypothetical protein